MAQKIRIVPAILTDDPKALEKFVRATESFTDFAQIDIMDGNFVPSNSISYKDIAPLKPRFQWEAHLMVQHPENYLEGFKNAGAQKIVFHFEAKTDREKTIKQSRELGMQVGLAVNPKTTIKEFAPLVELVDSVLFLSVEPGFYGARFIPRVLDKIFKFHMTYPKTTIHVDGGVKEDNIKEITQTGVEAICVGSAIFNRSDPADAYRRLVELVTA
ncbi:MAG: ribulose-phosphate 3-epimerase [Dehalococcoidales bacterium]|nr:ribulose-phosphate 3-epimerase [Dehalococcoidales bacterium]